MSGHNFCEQWFMGDWRLEDPGDAGTINADKAGICIMTCGASAETRTLPIPDRVGQLLMLTLDTDGGGGVTVTCPYAINQAGDVNIAFSGAGSTVTLMGATVGGALRWKILGFETATTAMGLTFT